MIRCLLLFSQPNKSSKRFITRINTNMKIKRTEQHAQFFALIESNIVKPRVITDMGWINGCWQEIAITKNTPIVSNIATRQPFGVSLADAFANANKP